MQQNILVDCLASGNSGVYVQQLLGKIDETLDRRRFQEAWQWLVERHPGLRACFDMGREHPVQRIVDSAAPAVEFVDWQAVTAEALDGAVEGFLKADRRRGFDLATAPLFRVTVLQLAGQRYLFVWTSHHLLFDGRSRYHLLKEFYALYSGDGKAEDVAAATPYRQFVERCCNQSGDQAELYWRKAWPLQTDTSSVVDALSGCASVRATGHGELQRTLSGALTGEIRHQSRSLGVGESTLFHAAWALFSNRYTGSDWTVFGVTRSCRRGDGDDLVGLYVNTVPLAVNLEPDDTVQSFLQRTRRSWRSMDGFDHAAASDIGQWRGNRQGLFDVILNFESYELNDRLRRDGREWNAREFQLHGITNLPLVISIHAGRQYKLEFVYDRSKLDDAMAASIYAQYMVILTQLVSMAGRPLAEIKLVSDDMFRALTKIPRTAGTRIEHTVVERFNSVVESCRGAVAVSHDARSVTYDELNAHADRIAAVLAKRGIRAGMRVGLLLDRSIEMVAALLGVLKAGAVYVPMDPKFPLERTRFITRDAGIALLVSERRHDDTALQTGVETIRVDSLENTPGPLPNLNIESDPDAPAYIMYTSGSTGDPKGVVIPHRGIVRLVCDNDYLPFNRERVFLLHSSLVFDASTFELWGPLLNGARCAILGGNAAELSSFGDTIRAQQVDCLWLTSSLFNLIVEERIATLKGVKYLLVGGEDLSVPHIRQALEALPDTQLINGYGPTENTTFSCTFSIPRNFDADRRRVPIGKPIQHTYAYIVDRAGMPVPPGCPGELLLGGAGLSLGYLNRDQLNASQFVADAFCPEAGARVYRTGDRCRWLDEQIEFLGRFDDQQKVRGFRVEPGETNAVLTRHPSVARAVTLVVDSDSGDKWLESWAVPVAAEGVTGGVLKDYVAQQLPHFSVPCRVNIVDTIPLTISGKVDRDKLLAAQPIEPHVAIGTQSSMVQKLMRIWSDVLGVSGVGPDSDFFDLGGNSLTAMRLLIKVEEQLGTRVPLSDFIHAPTPGSFAGLLLHLPSDFTPQAGEPAPSREEYVF